MLEQASDSIGKGVFRSVGCVGESRRPRCCPWPASSMRPATSTPKQSRKPMRRKSRDRREDATFGEAKRRRPVAAGCHGGRTSRQAACRRQGTGRSSAEIRVPFTKGLCRASQLDQDRGGKDRRRPARDRSLEQVQAGSRRSARKGHTTASPIGKRPREPMREARSQHDNVSERLAAIERRRKRPTRSPSSTIAPPPSRRRSN